MKKSFLIVLCVLSVITTLFGKPKKTAKNNGIKYISMRRTACFGRCPDYQVELFNNGMVKYSGYMFVKDTGVYEKNIGRARVAAIFKEIITFRIDTCKDEYNVRMTDVPGLYYTIKYNHKTKQITNANFGPYFLRDIANEIDKSVIVDKSWKKIADQAKR